MTDSKEHFNNMAKEWDFDSMRNKLADSIAKSIRSNVSVHGDKLLDFGCGTGLIAFSLADLVNSAEGWDTSTAMIDEFNNKAEKFNVNARAKYLDFEKDDYPANEFDVIVSGMVFHHIENIPSLLAKLHGCLKEGGHLAVGDLDAEDGTFHPPEIKGIHHFGFSRDKMTKWFEEAGFKNVKTNDVLTFDKDGKQYSIFLTTASKNN